MDLIRWRNADVEPAATFDRLQRQINRLFDEFSYWHDTPDALNGTAAPAVDIVENPDDYTVRCELPGISKKDIDVSVSPGIITIRGEKKGRDESNDGSVHRKEIWEGRFERRLTLPHDIDTEKVEASYENGVLSIRVPKGEAVRPRQIELKSS